MSEHPTPMSPENLAPIAGAVAVGAAIVAMSLTFVGEVAAASALLVASLASGAVAWSLYQSAVRR